MASRKKRKFRYSEKYAIWHCHGRRCRLCLEPLTLPDMSVDHFLPETLLNEDKYQERVAAISEHGLPKEFQINGYENLLPTHRNCNEAKGSQVLKFAPGNMIILERLRSRAGKVEETVRKIEAGGSQNKLFGIMMSELESGRISREELDEVVSWALEEPFKEFERSEVLLLNNGYWLLKSEVAGEGLCKCDRKVCVDSEEKIYCYHRPDQSPWVIKKGLFFKCYDEVIDCPRCGQKHKRGHIGSGRYSCGNPFKDQENQCD